MIDGLVLSANLGNSFPHKKKTLYKLDDPQLAAQIHRRIAELSPDVCLIQEIWNLIPDVLGSDYETIGASDCIAIKRSFGRIIPNSYHSHTFRFKRSALENPYPKLNDPNAVAIHRQRLQITPYDGKLDSPYGIPADFDITTALIETANREQFMVANVHVVSAPWNDQKRANQLRSWLLEEAIPQAKAKTAGRILIGGDFNQDEGASPNSATAKVIRQILQMPDIVDAASHDPSATTNYPWPIPKLRLDHLFGTCRFSDYRVGHSLLPEDRENLKRSHPFTWWMYLDHLSITARFYF